MKKKTDHVQGVIDEVVEKISALQDLLRGLHRLRAEREKNLPQRAQSTEPVRPRAEKRRENTNQQPRMDTNPHE